MVRVRVRVRVRLRARVIGLGLGPNPEPNPHPDQVGLRGKEAKLVAMTPLMPGWEEVDGGKHLGLGSGLAPRVGV